MDLHTLHIEHTVLFAVYTLLTLGNARVQRNVAGYRYFLLYNLLELLGSWCVAARGNHPNLFSPAPGNIFVLVAYGFLFQSMAALFSFKRLPTAVVWGWTLLGSGSMIWWGSLHPQTRERLLAYSLFLAGSQLFLGVLLLFSRRQTREVSWIFGSLLLALAAANTVRLATVSVHGVPQDYMQSGPTLAGILVVNTGLQCGLMMSFVWMTAAMLRRDLERRASTDPLTGLSNRRALEDAAARAVQAIDLGKGVFSAIVLDLDDFKPLNDRLGHAAGDHALQAVSRCLLNELRGTDLLARIGGDEFVLLLPRTGGGRAAEIAERLRYRLASLDLELPDPVARITGSFGIAEAVAGDSWEDLLARCDGALYAAKRRGGNAIFSHGHGDQVELERAFAP